MKRRKAAFLSASQAAVREASLLQANIAPLHGSRMEVDMEAGIIRNVRILTAGQADPANMGAFRVDETSLRQAADMINADPNGVRCRLTHPELSQGALDGMHDDIVDLVGRVKNAVVEGDRVRGDVHIGDYARHSPRGDMRAYLLSLAKNDPAAIGLSCRLGIADLIDMGDGQPPVARFDRCTSVDFVGKPGGNPSGLLSSGKTGGAVPPASLQEKEDVGMEKLKAFLSPLGLKKDATDEEAYKFLASLSGDNRVKGEALLTADDREKFGKIVSLALPAAPAPLASVAQPTHPVVPQEQIQKAVEAALAASKKREADIVSLCVEAKMPEGFAADLLSRQVSVDQAKELVSLAKKWQPETISVGVDRNIASLSDGMTDALLLRAGKYAPKEPHARAREFRGMSLVRMGEAWLAAHGVSTSGMSRSDIAELLFSRRKLMQKVGAVAALSMSTSDFPSILENTLRKTLRQSYDLTPTTWNRWARRATAPDFKQVSRVQISGMPALVLKREGAEYKYGAIGEAKEVYTLVTYGRGVKMAREMIINDDLSAFDRVLPGMGAMAKYLEDDVAYAVLTANAAMADTGLLFNTTVVTTAGGHANLSASSDALSVTALGAGRAAMRRQKGIRVVDPDTGTASAAILNLAAKYLLVPATKETIAEQLIGSIVDPAKQNATINPFANKLQVIAEPRLDDTSTTAWYLAADTVNVDTIEVCFLEDEPAPVLEQEDDFDTDSRKYKVRHTVAAAPIDFRGLWKNPGA